MKKIHFTLILAVLLFVVANIYSEDKEKFPFFPSLINTSTGKKVNSNDFEAPEVCQECHTDIYKQWKGSMHSNAWNDPVFQALWRLGTKETNGLTEKLCVGCHTSIGTVSDELVKKDSKGDYEISKIAQNGVQCDVCHTVKGDTYTQTKENEPHNATIVLDPGKVKRGPFKDSNSPHHETEYSELHTRSELCANCHHVYHPLNGFPIERTYDEWKNSVYAQNDITCQDCHMASVEDSIEIGRKLKKVKKPGKAANDGPDREHIYSHYFVGANFTIPSLLGASSHADLAKKRLQSAASLELTHTPEIKSGQMAIIKVKITNVGAGHNLPTSLTEVRQMWLDIEVSDADGKNIFMSGWLDKDYNIEPDAVIFDAYAVDKDGHHTVKPWEIVRFEYNHTIPPKGFDIEKYSFMVPKNVKGPLQINATLRYRSYPQSVANLLLGKGAPVLPIVDMVKSSNTIEIK